MFTYFYNHMRPIHVFIFLCPYRFMITYFNGHICHTHIYILLRTYTYSSSYYSTRLHALYMFIYFYAHILSHGYIHLGRYDYAYLYTSTPIYLCMYVRLHTSMPIFALNMFTNINMFTAIYAQYLSTYFYAHVPINIYKHLRSYIFTCLHTSAIIFP
jgi:hypothetical protein